MGKNGTPMTCVVQRGEYDASCVFMSPPCSLSQNYTDIWYQIHQKSINHRDSAWLRHRRKVPGWEKAYRIHLCSSKMTKLRVLGRIGRCPMHTQHPLVNGETFRQVSGVIHESTREQGRCYGENMAHLTCESYTAQVGQHHLFCPNFEDLALSILPR